MIKINNIHVSFGKKEVILPSSFEAHFGELTALTGPSGCGKSSLLNLISLFRFERDFDYFLDGLSLSTASDSDITQILRSRIAYLRQDSRFLSSLSCLDLLLMENTIAGLHLSEKQAKDILAQVDLADKSSFFPSRLSGGEKQRLAIAMALAKGADIIICDEITSALDERNTLHILSLLERLAHQDGRLIILASHEADVIARCDRIYAISDKRLQLVKDNPALTPREPEPPRKLKSLSLSFYFQAVASRMKKKKLIFISTILICGLTAALLNFFYTFARQDHDQSQAMLDLAVTNELFIINDPDEVQDSYGCYDKLKRPFSQEVLDQIMRTDGLTAVYPFFGHKVIKTYPTGNMNYNMVDIKYPDGTVTTVRISYLDQYMGSLGGETVFPYYPEQNLYSICEQRTSIQDGIYLDPYMAEEMNITELVDGMTISMEIYATAYTRNGTASGYGELVGSFTLITSQPYYEPVQMELPISGILPKTYYDCALIGEFPIHIPYETFMRYYEEAVSKHEMGPLDLPYEYRALKLFFSPETDRKELKKTLEDIDENLLVKDAYSDHLAQMEAVEDNNSYYLYIGLTVFLIAFILMVIYGLMHKKEVIEDDYFFNIRGVTVRDRKKMNLLEWLLTWLFAFIPAIILMNIFIVKGCFGFHLINRPSSLSALLLLNLFSLLICGLLTLLGELPLFLKRD